MKRKFYAAALLLLAVLSLGTMSTKEFYRNIAKRISYEREDYSYLSDDEFANFRQVTTTGIAPGKLYRSVSPIQAKTRYPIADAAARREGVKTFINLTDTDKAMREHDGFNGSYYSTQNILCLNMDVKFMSKPFQQKLAQAVRFMAANEAPYLLHCYWGKDRTGLTCAVIECLMGASAEEIVKDYMISFYNIFGIKPDTWEYDFIVKKEIEPFIASMLGIDSIYGVNLAEAAERYLWKIGVSSQDIAALKEKLSI